MKSSSLFIAALIMVGASVAAFGKEEPAKGLAVVPVKGTEVFKVIYKAENAGKVKINVYSATSQVVFTETYNVAEGFILPLNFSGLQSGDYTVEIVDATGKKTETVSFNPYKTAKNVHISKVGTEAGKYIVAIANAANEEITVKIYDVNNNLVHVESKTIAGDFAQVYTVKNIVGPITFSVTDKSGSTKTARF